MGPQRDHESWLSWNVVPPRLQLSPQQTKVVYLINAGKRDKEIARELGIAIPTVRTQISRMFTRFGATSRIELLAALHRVSALNEEKPAPHLWE